MHAHVHRYFEIHDSQTPSLQRTGKTRHRVLSADLTQTAGARSGLGTAKHTSQARPRERADAAGAARSGVTQRCCRRCRRSPLSPLRGEGLERTRVPTAAAGGPEAEAGESRCKTRCNKSQAPPAQRRNLPAPGPEPPGAAPAATRRLPPPQPSTHFWWRRSDFSHPWATPW